MALVTLVKSYYDTLGLGACMTLVTDQRSKWALFAKSLPVT